MKLNISRLPFRRALHGALASLAIAIASPATPQSQDGRDAFVEANILAIFYHELGHAVIDLMSVPIFGQEEDAADVMSVLLIDALYDEESAQSIAYDSAFGYIDDPSGTEEVAYWDLHGPDEQRYYNHVCLFYGANPDDRDDLAEDLGLPPERAETCPEEAELALESWGSVFEELEEANSAAEITYYTDAPSAPISALLAAEVEFMNEIMSFPETVSVYFEPCGEANAYYDPGEVSITMCTEFVDHLEALFQQHQ